MSECEHSWSFVAPVNDGTRYLSTSIEDATTTVSHYRRDFFHCTKCLETRLVETELDQRIMPNLPTHNFEQLTVPQPTGPLQYDA